MKKIILLAYSLTCLTFAQTGFLTPDGESAKGIWINHDAFSFNLGEDWKARNNKINFNLMTKKGFEIGLHVANKDEMDLNGFEIGYHHRMESLNIYLSLSRDNGDFKSPVLFSYNDGGTQVIYDDVDAWVDTDIDIESFWINMYSSDGLYGGLGGQEISSKINKMCSRYKEMDGGYSETECTDKEGTQDFLEFAEDYPNDVQISSQPSSKMKFELLKIGYIKTLKIGMTIGIEYITNKDNLGKGIGSISIGYIF